MKALTLNQPWASLVAAGVKTVELRGWMTTYRGPLLIHAGQHSVCTKNRAGLATGLSRLQERHGVFSPERFARLMDILNDEELPRGVFVARTHIDRCVLAGSLVPEPFSREELRSYTVAEPGTGRYAWMLGGVVPVNHPRRVQGQQGLWTPPEEFR